MPLHPTTYQFSVAVTNPIRIEVDPLGIFLFPAGSYIYTGSAKRSLEARIARHLRKLKAVRWHIDYLLSAPSHYTVCCSPCVVTTN